MADDPSDVGMVVRASEATILSDDLFHLMVNRGVRRRSAAARTDETMRGALADKGFVAVP